MLLSIAVGTDPKKTLEEWSKTVSALSIETSMVMNMAFLGDNMSAEGRERARESIEAEMKRKIARAKADVQTREERYKANKAAHDEAAFKVIDTNGDGTIQLSEFLAAFEPCSDRNTELHIALGFTTREEAEEQKRNLATEDDEPPVEMECNQQ